MTDAPTTQTVPETAPLSLTIDMRVYPMEGQSAEAAVRTMRERLAEYLTHKEFPLWEDYGVTVEDIAEAKKEGEPVVWGGYEGPFLTQVAVR